MGRQVNGRSQAGRKGHGNKEGKELTWTEREPRHVTDEGVDEYVNSPSLDEHLHRFSRL